MYQAQYCSNTFG